MMIENQLKALLEKTFECNDLLVENQSHLHAGHASSPGNGQSHFYIRIVSNDFAGKSRVECHRMVNEVVSPLFSHGLHALSLDIKVP